MANYAYMAECCGFTHLGERAIVCIVNFRGIVSLHERVLCNPQFSRLRWRGYCRGRGRA
jgi:hypothetical protein